MTTLIRPMGFQDIDEVYDIELAAHRAPWTREILYNCLLVAYDSYVLLDDGTMGIPKVIGYSIGRQHLNLYHVLNVCIHPNEQGKGYGRLMMDYLITALKNKKIAYIVLEVRPSNKAAIALYQSLGFHQEGIKENYYKDECGIEDALYFRKNLKGR